MARLPGLALSETWKGYCQDFSPSSVYTSARNMFLMILFFLIFFHYQFTLQPGIISWRYYSVLFYSISFDLNLFHLIHSPITSPHVLSVNFNKFVLRGFLFWGSLLLYENTTTAKLAYHNQSFYNEHNFISRKLVLRGFCYTWHEFWKIQYLLQQSKICSTKTTKHVLLITSACSLLCKSRKTCRLWDTEIYYITGMRVLNEHGQTTCSVLRQERMSLSVRSHNASSVLRSAFSSSCLTTWQHISPSPST